MQYYNRTRIMSRSCSALKNEEQSRWIWCNLMIFWCTLLIKTLKTTIFFSLADGVEVGLCERVVEQILGKRNVKASFLLHLSLYIQTINTIPPHPCWFKSRDCSSCFIPLYYNRRCSILQRNNEQSKYIYRSLQVYQRSYSQVRHRVLSDL